MLEEGIDLEYVDDDTPAHFNSASKGDTVASATMVRCSEVNMSLSMRFRWKNGSEVIDHGLRMGESGMMADYPQNNENRGERSEGEERQPDTNEFVLSFGIMWCPEERTWAGHIGEEANSWGIIHKESSLTTASFIGSRGNHYFAIDPIRVTDQFETSDEVRLDVNFKKSSAALIINSVFLHEFPPPFVKHPKRRLVEEEAEES